MTTLFNYTLLNKIARKGGVVLFGSTAMNNIPVSELMQDYGMNSVFYKRCIDKLKISDAEKCIDSCVAGLMPTKLILNLGEEDINDNCDMNKLIEDYRWLLYNIHAKLPNARLYVTSVLSEEKKADEFNGMLKKLAGENGCEYIKIWEGDPDNVEVEVFRKLKPVLGKDGLSYSDMADKAIMDILLPY